MLSGCWNVCTVRDKRWHVGTSERRNTCSKCWNKSFDSKQNSHQIMHTKPNTEHRKFNSIKWQIHITNDTLSQSASRWLTVITMQANRMCCCTPRTCWGIEYITNLIRNVHTNWKVFFNIIIYLHVNTSMRRCFACKLQEKCEFAYRSWRQSISK